MLPLVIDSNKGVDLTSQILSAADSFSDSFIELGKGIGGICLLIVAFYYLIAILEGGKFQIKMLLPLLIYFCVCIFGTVGKGAVGFTKIITKTMLEGCESARVQYMTDACNGEECNSLLSMFMYRIKGELGIGAGGEDAADWYVEKVVNGSGSDADSGVGVGGENDGSGDIDDDSMRKGFVGRLAENIGQALKDAGNSLLVKIHQCFSLSQSAANAINFTAIGFLCMLMQFLTSVLGYAVMAFGAMLTGLMVAVGPIVFAFAIFPGRGKYIGSWFIRLCQYSLWAPLVALMNCFTVVIFRCLLDAPSGVSTMFLVVCLVANIVALISVPAMSQIIIEGVTGGPSISSSLNTIEHLAGMAMMDSAEASRDAQQTQILESINSKLPDLSGNGGGFGNSDGSGGDRILGSNPNRDFGGDYDNGPGADYVSE